MPQKIKAEGLPGQAGWEKEKRLPELSMPTHRLLQPFCVHSLKVKLGRGLTLPRERLQGRIRLFYLLVHVRGGRENPKEIGNEAQAVKAFSSGLDCSPRLEPGRFLHSPSSAKSHDEAETVPGRSAGSKGQSGKVLC